MGPERLELSHIAALDPKSSASTNFATGPYLIFKGLRLPTSHKMTKCHFIRQSAACPRINLFQSYLIKADSQHHCIAK